jgi:hypothetical protein
MPGETQENPYEVLGVAPDASDSELRTAYRRLVQRHHPDHNGGTPESAVRFAQIQAAYAHVVGMRRGTAVPVVPKPGDVAPADPAVQRRIDEMERELARSRAAEARAAQARAARQAAARRKPTREELGYVDTEDSFAKIADDVADGLSDRWGRSSKKPLAQRLVDLFSRGEG